MTEQGFFHTYYDRAACDIGLVHIGYGAFHRAHQAVYIDDYMQATGDHRWGIAAVNLRASERETFAQATQAANGYLIKSIAADGGVEFRSVRSHVAFVDASDDLDAALELFEKPSVHAASMTVTESGYYVTEDWSLDLSAPAVQHDLDTTAAGTVYGFLTQALRRRMATTGAPITLLCCDNIRENGHVLKQALLAYLHAFGDVQLLSWVEDNVSFPCSMVDRITPRAEPALQAEVADLFPGYAQSSIHAEAFSQWVLEDNFAAAMPDLTRVGVQIVDSVEPYEETKIRILNGGHTGLAYFGALAGHLTFDAAMTDPSIRPHFDAWESEVLAGLPTSIPFNTSTYRDEIAGRFENRGIADQLERICMDGYSKMGIYVRPTLEACLAKGITPKAGYQCVASWVVYARRFRDGKTHIPYTEPFWDKLLPLIDEGAEDALAQDPQLWGTIPQDHPRFVTELTTAIKEMDKTWPV